MEGETMPQEAISYKVPEGLKNFSCRWGSTNSETFNNFDDAVKFAKEQSMSSGIDGGYCGIESWGNEKNDGSIDDYKLLWSGPSFRNGELVSK